MKPNTQAIRFIADTIGLHQKIYNQSVYGVCANNPGEAGEGASCGSPCCIAGFTVQFLGTPEGVIKHRSKEMATGYSSWKSNAVRGYAAELLGLDRAWEIAILNYGIWPEHWFMDGKQKLSSRRLPGDGYKQEPNADDAVSFLNRLADQFDKDEAHTRREQ